MGGGGVVGWRICPLAKVGCMRLVHYFNTSCANFMYFLCELFFIFIFYLLLVPVSLSVSLSHALCCCLSLSFPFSLLLSLCCFLCFCFAFPVAFLTLTALCYSFSGFSPSLSLALSLCLLTVCKNLHFFSAFMSARPQLNFTTAIFIACFPYLFLLLL